MNGPDHWMMVCPLSEVKEGRPVGVDVQGRKVGVYLERGEIHVLDNICTHAYALMSEGFQEDGYIECPLHGGKFDIRTGKALCPPLERDLTVYPSTVGEGTVYIRIVPVESATD
ncbi:non-heme iron oxygenase ferredoxin subunit [Paraburkholderia sp. BCC1885]|uniref:non-heme iron oxygenase ferredoxin subunit n=1 Tax=Paraburkholderia sp. BCC1885 TaxID=2562669 RepID=UPI0021B3EB14|nr:non-heme iron oxygenase ferredoxin subunit [Paraburkholderia sp. BCC1885]